MKKVLLSLLFVLFALTSTNAQSYFPLGEHVVLLFPKLDTLKLSWDHDWLDVNGNEEHVVYFEVEEIITTAQDTLILDLGKTPTDSISFRPPTEKLVVTFPFDGFYTFRVKAVDWAGNESVWHVSTDSTAWLEGWKAFKDNTKPSVGKYMKVE